MSFKSYKQNLKFLAIQFLTLANIGININTLKRQELLQSYGKFFGLIICALYLEYGMLNFAISISNIDAATGSLSMFNQGCLILIKISLFLAKGEKFMKLIWDMNLLAEKANSEEYKIWLKENRRAQLIGKTYYYACWLAAGFGGLVPLIFMLYDYNKNQVFNKKLPYNCKFPFRQDNIIIFIGNYLLSLIYTYALLNMTMGIDTLYGWYIHAISAHFRILRKKIQISALKLQNDFHQDYLSDIGSIVDYHNRTLKFVDDLNCIFGEILWVEVMLSNLQMCFVIYTLNNDGDVANIPFNFMVLVAIIIQMMIYCFGGEKIKDESLMLSFDLYLNFPWYKMPPHQRKLMLLPLLRSQKLSVLKGLFFDVDRKLFVYIVKTAFSFNALLSAIKE